MPSRLPSRSKPTSGTSTRSSQRAVDALPAAAGSPASVSGAKCMRRLRTLVMTGKVQVAAERERAGAARSRGRSRRPSPGRQRCACAGGAVRGARGARSIGGRRGEAVARRRPRGARRAGARAARPRSRQPWRQGRGATRLCRFGPLLSTQSNKWSKPRHLRLSATRRTCTMLPLSRAPGFFTLGSRGSQARIEHRR